MPLHQLIHPMHLKEHVPQYILISAYFLVSNYKRNFAFQEVIQFLYAIPPHQIHWELYIIY